MFFYTIHFIPKAPKKMLCNCASTPYSRLFTRADAACLHTEEDCLVLRETPASHSCHSPRVQGGPDSREECHSLPPLQHRHSCCPCNLPDFVAFDAFVTPRLNSSNKEDTTTRHSEERPPATTSGQVCFIHPADKEMINLAARNATVLQTKSRKGSSTAFADAFGSVSVVVRRSFLLNGGPLTPPASQAWRPVLRRQQQFSQRLVKKQRAPKQ